MSRPHPILRLFLWLFILASSGVVLVFSGTLLYLGPNLPLVERILEIQLQTPLRIYSSEGKLIAEFGEKKRTPIAYRDIPLSFVQAILAAEDARFFQHHGVDIKGLSRAVVALASTGEIQGGGSTITMQVAKNYFLSSEKTFLRKFNEILLALDLERQLPKERILELYVNKIYLGHRAYGLHAAAQVYYGKQVQELTLAQLAMLAGLPKAPSAFNPVTNPARAMERRNWILGRMQELGFIDEATRRTAQAEPNTAELFGIPIEVEAPYFAEMVRRDMVQRFGEHADTDGYRVFTTLKADNQLAATQALDNGLIAYDKRHGFRGVEGHIAVSSTGMLPANWQESLRNYRNVGPLQAAVVTGLNKDGVVARLRNGETIGVAFSSMQWARPFINNNNRGPAPAAPANVVKIGDVIRVQADKEQWLFSQVPAAQSALVSLDAHSGAIIALVGGFDFHHSKFNRVTQAGRQPGSSFKPFIYSAALDRGMTPATIINDAPIVLEASGNQPAWRPQNSGGSFLGPTRMREALYRSRNLVSIRILQEVGVPYAVNYASQFGFNPAQLPRNLSLALGTASLTPLDIATGYAVFANGGYKVNSWFIDRIEDMDGNVVFKAAPPIACDDSCRATAASMNNETAALVQYAPRVLENQTRFLLVHMLQDVVRRGTATRARELERSDLAGKTGTTNEQKDAWFSGFNPDVVATVWVGFDQPQNLGNSEFGATAALPIWIDYMRAALKDIPDKPLRVPDGIVSVRIDPESGLRTPPDYPDGILEYFREDNVPEFDWTEESDHYDEVVPEELF